ncbi:hypothetical protein CHS0354_016705 [Potamilus streckersoni]|uniref:Uncharacterized protein n=1 Tax=Potamilus streckersoni TaxID=2493646 RepID=A0AAE0TIE7_9BIVA|nr:hypothetical protein CHS0354_016705 [Potamilus streckersoni]
MNGGEYLCCIFLLTCIESCISLEQRSQSFDIGRICQYTSSLGCPTHDSVSWRCTKLLTNCSGDRLNRYHCVLNSTDEHFQVIHTCAPLLKCIKGTIPIYNKIKDAIICEPCPDGSYQQADVWSDETPECLQKHTCEKEGHKIECDMGAESHKIQDVYCRCDARNNYVLTHWERRGKCVEWAYATCYLHPCPGGQGRLLNYSCDSLCPQGQNRDDNDICVPISNDNTTVTPIIDNMTMSGKLTSPPTVTTTPTLTSEQPTRDNMSYVIASAVIIPVILLFIMIFECWKCKLFEKCWSIKKQRSRKRHSHTDADPNGAAQRDTSQNMTDAINPTSTDKGTHVHHHHYHEKTIFYVKKAKMLQFGNNSQIKSVEVHTEQPETHEVSSLSSSEHSSDLQLADSPPLHNSSQGELPVNRNFSEDIEFDTQPNQISDGMDTSERHSSSEETYRKVVE